MTPRPLQTRASHWRLAIAVIALLGAMPRNGLYVHHHARGEHAHVHLTAAPPRRATDPLAALRIFEVAARHVHAHADGPAHSHLDGDVAEHGHAHDHAELHDHAAGPSLAQADAHVVAPAGHDHASAPCAAHQPGDHRPALVADLDDTATHWHASSPLHHLAVTMRVRLHPAGIARALPSVPCGRPLVGTSTPTHARGPPLPTLV